MLEGKGRIRIGDRETGFKPGDVIELPGMEGESAFGWVKHMGARHTEIVTRDNKSYLIPNEDFIIFYLNDCFHISRYS